MLTSTERIYLNFDNSTPCDPHVVAAFLPYFSEIYGNASSQEVAGYTASEAVEAARQEVAALLGARAREIVFTSGATESNNLALLGVARRAAAQGARRRIVTTAIEHKAVLEPCAMLAREGFEIVVLPVDETGRVCLEAAQSAINDDTLLVSIQAANNEVGTLQDVAGLAALAHEHGAFVHCDAAQAAGKIPIDVVAWGVDLLSLSAHKFYGPKGVGALFVRGGVRRFPIAPLTAGGGQENALRPGTLNVPGIVGLGAACRLAQSEMAHEAIRVGALRDCFEQLVREAVPNVRFNGCASHRLPGNSSLTFPGIPAEALLANLPHLALSTGSACTSGAVETSHVLLALGLSREQALSTIRVGLGRFTTADEIETAARDIAAACARIRTLH